LVASLSDAWPQNIKFGYGSLKVSQQDPYTKKMNVAEKTSNEEIVPGVIPGDGLGHSCGSLGGMTYLGEYLFAVTYFKKACSLNESQNDVTEIGLIFAKTSFTILQRSSIVQNVPNVNVLKSAKYGLYILVIYGTTEENPELFPTRSVSPTDTMNVMLVSVRGTVKTESKIVVPYSLTANDDLEVLSDGSVVWGSVNETGHYVLYRLPISENPAFLQYFNSKTVKDLLTEEENDDINLKLVKQKSGKSKKKNAF
jgi:hypothetical protein